MYLEKCVSLLCYFVACWGFLKKNAEGLSCALFMANAPFSDPELMGMGP